MVFWALIIGALIIVWLYKLNKDYVVMALFAKRVHTADGTSLENSVATFKGSTIFANAFDLAVSGDNAWRDGSLNKHLGVGGIVVQELAEGSEVFIDRCFISINILQHLLDEGVFATVFEFSRKLAARMKRSYLQYGLFMPFYNIITPEDAELVMSDQKNLITKGIVYNFMVPFLNKGLLTSSGKQWHSRRKMLTPAFHFNILGQFEEVFKEESSKFVRNLEAGDLNCVILNEIIPKFTLNSVCETALGVKLDEQMNADQYRASFRMIEEIFVVRISNPLYMIGPIYKLFLAPKIENHITIVHNFSSEIINKRRQLFAAEHEQNGAKSEEDEKDISFTKKKRFAMLDTLLHAERDGLIDHAGICEEVDTFMFEGFDTTSAVLIFSLMNLSLYPEMQERCYQEILEHVEDDISKLDINQLSKLKYLECFIKETLRLYPSVPVITRKAASETRLANNLVLPEGAQINIHIFDIHRNPKYWDNPNAFDPERFTSERSVGRHPFAFVPFSAGQRNCIGQKFAMLEMKTLLINILKSFKIQPSMDDKDLQLQAGMIIRTPNAVKVKLEKRV